MWRKRRRRAPARSRAPGARSRPPAGRTHARVAAARRPPVSPPVPAGQCARKRARVCGSRARAARAAAAHSHTHPTEALLASLQPPAPAPARARAPRVPSSPALAHTPAGSAGAQPPGALPITAGDSICCHFTAGAPQSRALMQAPPRTHWPRTSPLARQSARTAGARSRPAALRSGAAPRRPSQRAPAHPSLADHPTPRAARPRRTAGRGPRRAPVTQTPHQFARRARRLAFAGSGPLTRTAPTLPHTRIKRARSARRGLPQWPPAAHCRRSAAPHAPTRPLERGPRRPSPRMMA